MQGKLSRTWESGKDRTRKRADIYDRPRGRSERVIIEAGGVVCVVICLCWVGGKKRKISLRGGGGPSRCHRVFSLFLQLPTYFATPYAFDSVHMMTQSVYPCPFSSIDCNRHFPVNQRPSAAFFLYTHTRHRTWPAGSESCLHWTFPPRPNGSIGNSFAHNYVLKSSDKRYLNKSIRLASTCLHCRSIIR